MPSDTVQALIEAERGVVTAAAGCGKVSIAEMKWPSAGIAAHVDKLVLCMRLLNKSRWQSRRWSDLSFNVASLEPVQKSHPAIVALMNAREQDSRRERQELATENIIRQVLLQSGEPLGASLVEITPAA